LDHWSVAATCRGRETTRTEKYTHYEGKKPI
jgi:hypothetical protein